MLNVIALPAFSDNYIWVIENPGHKTCAIVDPGDAGPVLDYLKHSDYTLSAVLITHHHADHIGGITAIIEQFPAPVYGPAKERIPHCQHPLNEPDEITIENLASFKVMDIPGHTLGHIAYHSGDLLFCGDTLFAGGCGRVFEGTNAQMLHSLSKLAALSPNTRIFCAHEYTEANLRFAEHVEPNNKDIKQRLQEVQNLRQTNTITIPSLLESELKTNPFLRCHEQDVIDMAEQVGGQPMSSAEQVFGVIRKWKNRG